MTQDSLYLGRRRAAVGCAVALFLAATISACGNDPADNDAGNAAVDAASTDTAQPDTGAADGHDADADADAVAVDAGPPDTANWTGKCAAGPTFCDDGNPCTEDRCDPLTGCYTSPVPCADDDPCTVDACVVAAGGCQHSKNNCDDNNICTEGACDAKLGCAYTLIDCGDADACTSDGCSPAAGCVHSKLDCDDHKTCTVDACDAQSGCTHIAPPEGVCCENAVDCEDDNVCTLHTCTAAGICASVPVFGCCGADKDCDDGNPCTADACAVAAGTCANAFVAGDGCCEQDVQCQDNEPCTLDVCFNGQCGHEAQCCKVANDCLAGATATACTTVSCTSGACSSALAVKGAQCCKPMLSQTGFESGDSVALNLSPSDHGVFSVENGPPAEVSNGAGALRFEVVGATIPGGKTVARAVLPVVELPAGTAVTLSFWVRTQLIGGASADKLRLRVDTAVGSRLLWTAASVAPWTQVKIDLRGYAGRPATQKPTLIFEVQPSGSVWVGSKAWIDDIELTSTCQTVICAKSSDCDDSLGATDEVCVAGVCSYTSGTGYCESVGNCNDKNNCTVDSCNSGYACDHVAIPDCCTKTAECDDANVCTTDLCSASKCKHTAKPGSICCAALSDCDDANPCTTDSCPTVGLPCQWTQTDPTCCVTSLGCEDGQPCTLDLCQSNTCLHKQQCCTATSDCVDGDECTDDGCVAGLCGWNLLTKPGCCEPNQLTQDFESGFDGVVIVSELPTSKWQHVIGKQAKNGKGSLWYGNLAKGNFDDGKSGGTVTIPGVAIASGEQTIFAFSLWMDTESGQTYDRFEVFVVNGGKKTKLWDKTAAGFTIKQWHDAKVELSAFAGATVDLRFEFDTTDGVANTGEGVYVDAITLTRSCAPKNCNTAKDCDDGLPSTSESCSAGSCIYSN
jgi:hypothetical protein